MLRAGHCRGGVAVIFGSVCSGIEAASVAWHPLGWRAAFLSDIEAFPRALLRHHYPDVPLRGDFTEIQAGEHEPIGLLVGGTPCQSFSIAGLRGGMDDDRGNLALEYLRLADRLRPRWLVWENVPGVLSSNGGRDFGSILGGMGELGYGVAYRVLDAQYVRTHDHPRAVPQRRRRVFVVGYFGDWRRAAAVLFERHSLSGHPAPRRETRKDVAPTISARPTGGGELGTDFDLDGGLIASTGDTAHCLNAGGMGRQDYETETMVVQPICFSAKDHGADAMSDLSPTLRAGGHSKSHANAGVMPAIAFSIMPMNSGKDFKGRETDIAQPVMAAGPSGSNQGGDYVVQPIAFDLAQITSTANRTRVDPSLPASTLNAKGDMHAAYGSAVRRLTPRECERLQGFPDDYTAVPHRGKPAADGPRYKALGNSMAVPVMRWIGERIQAVDAMTDPDASPPYKG